MLKSLADFKVCKKKLCYWEKEKVKHRDGIPQGERLHSRSTENLIVY